MAGVEQKIVQDSEDGLRLDRWFSIHFPGLTHGRLQKLLRTGQVRVDGGRVKAKDRLQSGQNVRIPPLQVSARKRDSHIRLSEEDNAFVKSLVIYRDQRLIVLNKPSGLAVQGGTKTTRHLDGLLDGLRFEAEERPRLVHRLDRDTSGVLLLARSRHDAAWIGQALRQSRIQKVYWALISGVPRVEQATINMPLIKKGRIGSERVVAAGPEDKDAQNAKTHYMVVDKAAPRWSWVALMPVTGRTHQLRVHLSEIGHSIVGDLKYGDQSPADDGLPNKLHLHARSLGFKHPDKGWVKFDAELPDHMQSSWEILGFDGFAEDPQFPDELVR